MNSARVFMEMMRSMGGFKDSIRQMRNVRFTGESGMVKVHIDGLGRIEKVELGDVSQKVSGESLAKLIVDASQKAYAQMPLSSDNLDFFLNNMPTSGFGAGPDDSSSSTPARR